MMSNTPHDALVKAILSRPEHAATALRAMLPAELSAALDWSALRTEPASYVSVEGGARHSDLLFAIPLRGDSSREVVVYVLFEHQSSSDPLMALRLFVYVARLFEDRVLRARLKHVPLVVPIVLAHAEQPWVGALSLDGLYDAPSALLEALGPLVPRLSYLLEDLTSMTDDDIGARVADSVVRTTWTVLRDARRSEDLFAYAKRLGKLLVEVHRQDRPAFATLFEYLLRTKDADPATARKVADLLPAEAQEDIVTAYDRIHAEGEAEGEARGEAKGKAEGKLDGRRAALAKQLQLKFGALDDVMRARLDTADEAQLDLWAERILFAASLDQMLTG